jgi:hypothetical protein
MAVSLTASAKVVPSFTLSPPKADEGRITSEGQEGTVRRGLTTTACPTGFDDYSLRNVAARACLAALECKGTQTS